MATLARLRVGYPLVRAVVWYDDIDGPPRLPPARRHDRGPRQPRRRRRGLAAGPDIRYLAP